MSAVATSGRSMAKSSAISSLTPNAEKACTRSSSRASSKRLSTLPPALRSVSAAG